MTEEWRDIAGYEGIYQVSNFGRVKRATATRRFNDEHILQAHDDHHGYDQVRLCKDGKQITAKVSRLVATAFLPNPDNLPEVNHKDEDKTNNCVTNLEWCTHIYNSRYGTRGKRIGKAHAKPIVQCSINGTFIRRWNSVSEVTDTLGYDQSNICKCLTGKYSNAYGYVWKYVKQI